MVLWCFQRDDGKLVRRQRQTSGWEVMVGWTKEVTVEGVRIGCMGHLSKVEAVGCAG